MLAVGLAESLARWRASCGANASESSVEMRVSSHLMVMESGKSSLLLLVHLFFASHSTLSTNARHLLNQDHAIERSEDKKKSSAARRQKKTYGLSTTKTSSSSRSPNAMPLLTNSFRLVSPSPSALPTSVSYVSLFVSRCHLGCCPPVLRHRILTWLPVSGRVNANTVGAKNMASSSGCAINKQMRLFSSFGNRSDTTLTVYMYSTGISSSVMPTQSRLESMIAM